MRQPDLAVQPTAATVPTQGMGRIADSWQSGDFAALSNQVRADVSQYIDQGDAASLASQSIGAEAQWLRQGVVPSAATTPLTQAADAPDQQAFLSSIAPWAEATGQRLGVAPDILAAHAALESGWGQRPLRNADGSDTHNLFGIKAGGDWQGDVATAMTTEYIDGTPVKKTERFRSYADPSDAFRDYAQILQSNPRYRAALNVGNDAQAFAQGLARGGFATDPAYAGKLAQLATRLQSRH